MSQPVIALQDSNSTNLFEASNIYKVAGQEPVPADRGGHRLDRPALLPLLDVAQHRRVVDAAGRQPRATRSPAAQHTSSRRARWTKDISHGEMIRAGVDQTLTIARLQAPVPVPGHGSQRRR